MRLALYHSAGDGDDRESVSRWEDVGTHLFEMADRWQPYSVGINLVELMAEDRDAAGLVRSAAEVLLRRPSD